MCDRAEPICPKLQAEFVWSIQRLYRAIYREWEQDNSMTEPFGDTDFEANYRHFLDNEHFFRSIVTFSPVSRDICKSVQLLSFSLYNAVITDFISIVHTGYIKARENDTYLHMYHKCI